MSFTFDSYAVATFIGLAIFLLIKQLHYWKRIPPGPWGLPFIGLLAHLNIKDPMKELEKYKEKYGKMFSFNCGDFLVVVVNDHKMVTQMSKKEEFNGRPDFEVWVTRNQGKKNRGILFADADSSWSEQRRFALRNLRDFGFGKKSMEEYLTFELQQLLNTLKESLDTPVDIADIFNASVLNSLWTILTGKRFAQDDPLFNQLMGILHSFVRANNIFNPGVFYPWPAKYNLVKRGLWQQRIDLYNGLTSLINNIIEEHKVDNLDGPPRDFMDCYLSQIKEGQPGSSFHSEDGIKSLQVVMLDLFSAGVETTSTTILFAMLYVSKFPEIQKKLQEEIDRVIGRDRLPCRDDKSKMIYMEAFTNEVHRKSTVIPMSVYHKVMKDSEYGGYLLPKGAILLLNLHDVHHDKDTWGDPQNFRPERFLDESGTQLKKYEELVPFSYGKRVCLGETLARDNLFIFLSGLLQAFSFELAPNSKNVDINAKRPNFVMSPLPFEVIITKR